jgi:hypothetical protein
VPWTIEEIELNILLPCHDSGSKFHGINLSPTKLKSKVNVNTNVTTANMNKALNVLVLAETTLKNLDFRRRPLNRKKFMEKLLQVEIQLEWVKIRYGIQIHQIKALLISPSLRTIDRRIMDDLFVSRNNKRDLNNIYNLYSTQSFILWGI